MSRIVIFGSRSFGSIAFEQAVSLVDEAVAAIGVAGDVDVVISGCARGADSVGEAWAANAGIDVEAYPYPSAFGKVGGHFRNAVMAREADIALGFWDGSSPGTRSMIGLCRRYLGDSDTYVVFYRDEGEPVPVGKASSSRVPPTGEPAPWVE